MAFDIVFLIPYIWKFLRWSNFCHFRIFYDTPKKTQIHEYSMILIRFKKIGLKTLYPWNKLTLLWSVQFKNQKLWVNRICCRLLLVVGTLGLKLLHGTSEKDHIQDCVSLIKQTVKQLFNGTLTQITDTPTSCKNSSSSWQAGNSILQWVSLGVGLMGWGEGGGGEGKQSKLWLQVKKKNF